MTDRSADAIVEPAPSKPTPAVARRGAWAKRPAGVPAVVPPPSLPLTFLAATALGVIACGIALAWVAPTVVADPTAGTVVGAAQFGTLAVLSMGVLGALHQFAPVVSQRALRSAGLGRATFVVWAIGAWLIPIGLVARTEPMVAAGGAAVVVAVVMVIVNLSGPLSARGKGAAVVGLRLGLVGLVVTAASGATFVADRSGAWFVLPGHVVLAHALVGIFAWLGLVYIAVAEKLWPMFLLAHLPGRHRSGAVAVWTVPAGVILLSVGLWRSLEPMAWIGAAILAAGLAAHLVSMVAHVRHRRRGADLHLAFVLTAAVWLVVGAAIGLAAAVAPVGHLERERLVGAAIAALAGWLLTALVGHAHKVVPFIAWTKLRSAGVDQRRADGRPLLFADLYDARFAKATYALTAVSVAGIGIGLLADVWGLIVVGGVAMAAAGLIAGVNLSAKPVRLLATVDASRPAESRART